MRVLYPDKLNFYQALRDAPANSLDVVVFATGAFAPINIEGLKRTLAECVRALRSGGLLFVQGYPDYLPEVGVYLETYLNFKYWIAIESDVRQKQKGLPSVHAAVLLFVKGNSLKIRRVRFPHKFCAFCGKPLKDWGGKTHLMHPEGYAISDVWRELPRTDNYTQISAPVLNTIMQMLDIESANSETYLFGEQSGKQDGRLSGVIGPREGIEFAQAVAEPRSQYVLPGFSAVTEEKAFDTVVNEVTDRKIDVVIRGDAVEVLKRYPDNSIDLVFADPPYNLDKPYNVYDDEREVERYIAWCNTWLKEYIRVLKPTGSLYVLNLPRWAMHHAVYLNQHLYFQNWIVWDALSEPRGKLMPAHYGLLFYTKHPTDFTFNYDEVDQLDARHYCLRSSCIRQRKRDAANDKEPLTDIWWNIHRIKHRRDRDYHPCQLPEALLERLIRLSTNSGDIVLDALSGAGTTAVTAARLGRRYVAIDIDEKYVRITKEKIAQVERNGQVERKSVSKPHADYTKKELQLELRDLAARLGRLPTPEDVRRMSQYDIRLFYEMFPTWGKALKAAKLEIQA